MTSWTGEFLSRSTAGQWLSRVDPSREFSGVSTDTRAILPGQLFVAIRGDQFDGHEFLQDAARAGAGAAMVHRVPRDIPSGLAVLRVADTRKALGDLAFAHRSRLDATVIAVAGSNGKTTTTRLIDAVLSASIKGTASAKSFNNDIGVPLTILRATPEDRYLLCEVGTNAPGELLPLARMIRPDVGVLTSIGREHLEGFSTLEGVIEEELSILDAIAPGGCVIVNADNEDLDRAVTARAPSCVRRRVGSNGDTELAFSLRSASFNGSTFSLGGRECTTKLLGIHNALNAALALAVSREMGLDWSTSLKGLAAASGPPMRLEAVEEGGVRVLNDAYNANPDSALAALRVFSSVKPAGSRGVVVFADMLELGPDAPAMHREIGRAIASTPGVDRAFFIGELSRHAADEAIVSMAPASVTRHDHADDQTMTLVAEMLEPGDFVLLKGSRRNALERIVRRLSPAAAFAR
ncbi:MAG: UDP-N-acetylmuramoyl-tripeptide--D-alanyl-D-alanine ligase [Phycisphaerales bacterium]|nr:MAG: UDP-N-acetylmuramoyl-tripeptide--D-alanyl-D-alanine ligase [Phycisphaerales bacterium]